MLDIELLIQLQKNAVVMLYILMMVILYANLVTTNGFLTRNLLIHSYECSVNPTHCTSCDDSNTKRTLSTNACPCTVGFFDNGIKVCEPCDYSWFFFK